MAGDYTTRTRPSGETSWRLAEEYRCNLYDACYLALPFVFADDKLERQLAGRIPLILRSSAAQRSGVSKDALPLVALDLA